MMTMIGVMMTAIMTTTMKVIAATMVMVTMVVMKGLQLLCNWFFCCESFDPREQHTITSQKHMRKML